MKPKDKNKELRIISETLDIVSKTGIAGIKMSVLAKRVGISPSTLYVYFKTKEDLINSIAKFVLEHISQEDGITLISEESFEISLKGRWLKMIEFLINNEREVNFIEQWKTSPYFNTQTAQLWSENKKIKQAFFDQAKMQNVIKDLDDHMIHAVVTGITKEYVNQIKSGEQQLDQQTSDLFFSLIWDALKK